MNLNWDNSTEMIVLLTILFVGYCQCAVTITPQSQYIQQGSSITIIATTDEGALTWTYKSGESLSLCIIPSSSCVSPSVKNMALSADSATNTSTITISSVNCSINTAVYIATTSLDVASADIIVTIPESSVDVTPIISTGKVSTQELSFDIPCVFPQPVANFTITRQGKPDETISDVRVSSSNSGCSCTDAATYTIETTITASSYPDEVVVVTANVGSLSSVLIGTVNFTGVSPDEKDECLNVGLMFLSALSGSMIVILALCFCCQGHKHKWKIILWTAVLSVEYDLILALSFYNICVYAKWPIGLFCFGGVVIALIMACIAKKAHEENGFWYYVLLIALTIIGVIVIKCLLKQLKKAEEPDDTKITNADDSSTTNGNNHESPTNIIVSTTGNEKKSLENNHESPTNITVSTTGKEKKSLEPIPGVFTQNAGNNHESPTNIIVSTTGKEKKSLEPIPGVFTQNAGESKLNQKPFGTAVPLPSIHSSKEVNP